MLAIWSLTLSRLREPPFIVMFVLGCGISFAFARVGVFDVAGLGIPGLAPAATDSKTETGILLGTILLAVLGALITVFVAAAEVPRDISSRLIAVILSKPISRPRYIAGKYLGTLTIGLLFSFLWLILLLVVRQVTGGSTAALPPDVILEQFNCLLLLLPIGAIAIAISCFFSDVVAMILTSIYVLVSFAAGLVPVILNIMQDDYTARILLLPYYLFPNLSYFLQPLHGPWQYVNLATYALSLSALFLVLGQWRFSRGDVFAGNR